MQIFHIVGKSFDMNDIRIPVVSIRPSVSAMVKPPDIISVLKHVIGRFGKLAHGFGKAVADDDHALGLVRFAVLVIQLLSFFPFKEAILHPRFDIRLDFGAHLFLITLFCDPIHLNAPLLNDYRHSSCGASADSRR